MLVELAGVKPASERVDIRRSTSLVLYLFFRPADKAEIRAIRRTIPAVFFPFRPGGAGGKVSGLMTPLSGPAVASGERNLYLIERLIRPRERPERS